MFEGFLKFYQRGSDKHQEVKRMQNLVEKEKVKFKEEREKERKLQREWERRRSLSGESNSASPISAERDPEPLRDASPKRGRGRPKKLPILEERDPELPRDAPPKRGRGRPRKLQPESRSPSPEIIHATRISKEPVFFTWNEKPESTRDADSRYFLVHHPQIRKTHSHASFVTLFSFTH